MLVKNIANECEWSKCLIKFTCIHEYTASSSYASIQNELSLAINNIHLNNLKPYMKEFALGV